MLSTVDVRRGIGHRPAPQQLCPRMLRRMQRGSCRRHHAVACMCCAFLAVSAAEPATALQPVGGATGAFAQPAWVPAAGSGSSADDLQSISSVNGSGFDGSNSDKIHWPDETERRATARDVLTVLAGKRLHDQKRVGPFAIFLSSNRAEAVCPASEVNLFMCCGFCFQSGTEMLTTPHARTAGGV